MAQYLDKAGATYLIGRVKELLNDKVDKVSGKGLSTNDYTTAEKNKLAGIDTTVFAPLSSPTFTGTPNAPTPTAGNSSTQIATTAFVMSAVAGAVGGVTSISYEIVTSLPATGEAGKIYLISNSGSSPNSYDEYLWINGSFEKIGTTDVNLSGYVQSSDLVAITNTEIAAMFT